MIQKRIFRVKFLHISGMFTSYKQMVSSAMEARFRSIFMRIIEILPGFSNFPVSLRFTDYLKFLEEQSETKLVFNFRWTIDEALYISSISGKIRTT